MKTFWILFASLLVSTSLWGQQGFTFKIDDLSAPEALLEMRTPAVIYEDLLLSDLGKARWEIERDSVPLPFNILSMSALPDSLVNIGYQSFFQGVYRAYAQHRPLVLSPDMIWLLIAQGFSQHVNAHAEELRHLFVEHSGKLSLVVRDDRIDIYDPQAPWEGLFPAFADSIAKYTGTELVEALTADFTTTTPVTRIASQITLMKAVESYFEYIHIARVCGIPEITLLGTSHDWQQLLDKTRFLSRYDLAWWTDELLPVLQEFVDASNGKVNLRFWRDIVQRHSSGMLRCGGGGRYRSYYDGWFIKFYPYDKDGKRLDLKRLDYRVKLPDEIVKVDMKSILHYPDGHSETIPLELWAGFVGLSQDRATFTLKPEIGWMIRKKDTAALDAQLERDTDSEIYIRVRTVPSGILSLEKINSLRIDFIDRIAIPDELAAVEIGHLNVSGKISQAEIQRLIALFPDTELYINDEMFFYYRGKKYSVFDTVE